MKFTGSGDMIFGHSDYGHYTMELNRGTWALTLQLKGTPSGSDQELGSFPTLAKAQAYALKTDKMLAKLDKQSGFGRPVGITKEEALYAVKEHRRWSERMDTWGEDTPLMDDGSRYPRGERPRRNSLRVISFYQNSQETLIEMMRALGMKQVGFADEDDIEEAFR